jgi:hypothetical protein
LHLSYLTYVPKHLLSSARIRSELEDQMSIRPRFSDEKEILKIGRNVRIVGPKAEFDNALVGN